MSACSKKTVSGSCSIGYISVRSGESHGEARQAHQNTNQRRIEQQSTNRSPREFVTGYYQKQKRPGKHRRGSRLRIKGTRGPQVREIHHNCAPFCAHSRYKTIANGRRGVSARMPPIYSENQYHSKLSHSVRKASAATVNRRVASSNLARGANLISAPHWIYAASSAVSSTAFCSPSSPSNVNPSPTRSHHSRLHASSFSNPAA